MIMYDPYVSALGEASRKSLQKLALANVRSVGYNKEHRISISFLSSFHSHEKNKDRIVKWIEPPMMNR